MKKISKLTPGIFIVYIFTLSLSSNLLVAQDLQPFLIEGVWQIYTNSEKSGWIQFLRDGRYRALSGDKNIYQEGRFILNGGRIRRTVHFHKAIENNKVIDERVSLAGLRAVEQDFLFANGQIFFNVFRRTSKSSHDLPGVWQQERMVLTNSFSDGQGVLEKVTEEKSFLFLSDRQSFTHNRIVITHREVPLPDMFNELMHQSPPIPLAVPFFESRPVGDGYYYFDSEKKIIAWAYGQDTIFSRQTYYCTQTLLGLDGGEKLSQAKTWPDILQSKNWDKLTS